jgi:hypothetical protein
MGGLFLIGGENMALPYGVTAHCGDNMDVEPGTVDLINVSSISAMDSIVWVTEPEYAIADGRG